MIGRRAVLPIAGQPGAIARNIDNVFSDLARVYLNRIHSGKGDHVASVIPYQSLFHTMNGGHPLYPDFIYSQIAAEESKKCDVDLVDAGSVLNDEVWVYRDCCHFSEQGHRRVASLLVPHIRNILSRGRR